MTRVRPIVLIPARYCPYKSPRDSRARRDRAHAHARSYDTCTYVATRVSSPLGEGERKREEKERSRIRYEVAPNAILIYRSDHRATTTDRVSLVKRKPPSLVEELELERTCSTNQRPFFHPLPFVSLPFDHRLTTTAVSLSLSRSNNYNILASLLNHFARRATMFLADPKSFHRFSFLCSLFQVCIGLDSPVDTHRSGGRRRFENGEQPRRPGKRLSVTRLHGKWFSRIPRFVTFLRLRRLLRSDRPRESRDHDNRSMTIAKTSHVTYIYIHTYIGNSYVNIYV